MTEVLGECLLARRAVLLGGLGVVLAGCSSGGGGQDPPSQGSGPEQPPATTAGGGELVALKDVPVGGGYLAAGDVLVVQNSAGSVVAFDARCPHALTLVGLPNGSGVITCPGHFARFRASDGEKIDGPAPTGLRRVEVTVRDGKVMRG